MRPVVIFRFSGGDEPGHFTEWLDAAGLPWRLVALDQGAPVPADAEAFAGIGMMGGPMSVNDALPWVAPIETLLRKAVVAGVPVIGHCLGGQLLAKALGAKVARARNPEIGWIPVEVCAGAEEWFPGRREFTTFEWHYEGFELPTGATRVLANAFHVNQAFVLEGRHVGLQGHIEMTCDIARHWVAAAADELPAQATATTQPATEILRDLELRVATLNAVAGGVYARWSQGLRR